MGDGPRGPKGKDTPPRDKAAFYGKLAYSNLAHLLSGGPDVPVVISISLRPRDNDFLAVLSAVEHPSFRRVVMFASGPSIAECLANLNSEVGRGTWREDKFFKKGGA
jgi:hypothetical protein